MSSQDNILRSVRRRLVKQPVDLIFKEKEDLVAMRKKEIERNIRRTVRQIKEIEKSDVENKRKKKQNLGAKLKKLRAKLEDDELLERSTTQLKNKKKKLKRVVKLMTKHQQAIKKRVFCLNCRKKGHKMEECTELAREKDVLCFNCGSNEHNCHNCDKPVDYANLPFATCFICKEKGHLSSKCPQSDKGIYVRGGTCFNCDSKDHLARDCPLKHLDQELLGKKREN